MREISAATPFGRRTATLGQIAAQMQVDQVIADAGKPGSNQPAAVNKWTLFRTLTQIRARLGVSDRALSVLNALLSFHQETALSLPALRKTSDPGGEEDGQGASCDLIVFPSNKALCLRAHGMTEPTLRRHLAALVEAGLIIRRDSPNGKRYARKDASRQQRFSDAFGFDLTPLVTRAPEFESLAEAQRRERQATALLKERISLHRRDVAKLIALGLDEALAGPWEDFRQRFMRLVTPLRRIRLASELNTLATELASLRQDVTAVLHSGITIKNNYGNDTQNDRHQSNTNTQSTTDSEPASKEEGAGGEQVADPTVNVADAVSNPYPLAMVIEACPDVTDYAAGSSIRNWQQFLASVRLLRPMLGISPDAWRGAIEMLGEVNASIVVATILQRSEHSSEASTIAGSEPGSVIIVVNGSPAIKSPGGYLRALTQKAGEGEFALGPVLMALMGQRLKAKRGRVGTSA